ncbi:UTP--glucose-1-phosphate uridylyltransferase GalU [Spongorhabdus nitratireducens]
MEPYKKVRKAVFPVAGLGTRFLPATKACPKEMLPVVDKPLIQYAVEEAIAAGMTDLIFVTSWTKRSIEDHFDKNFELEHKLMQAGKDELLRMVEGIIPPNINCFYVRQKEALGLGHAVLCSRDIIGPEPFAVILADDLIQPNDSAPCLGQMASIALQKHASVVAVESIDDANISSYGVIDPATSEGDTYRLNGIVEKPPSDLAPSNLGVIGRYIFQPEIFNFLEQLNPGINGEVQLTDAIYGLLKEQEVYGFHFQGIRHDCGYKLGFLIANIELGLKHPDIQNQLGSYLSQKAIRLHTDNDRYR